jgi:hypothetical protein
MESVDAVESRADGVYVVEFGVIEDGIEKGAFSGACSSMEHEHWRRGVFLVSGMFEVFLVEVVEVALPVLELSNRLAMLTFSLCLGT